MWSGWSTGLFLVYSVSFISNPESNSPNPSHFSFMLFTTGTAHWAHDAITTSLLQRRFDVIMTLLLHRVPGGRAAVDEGNLMQNTVVSELNQFLTFLNAEANTLFWRDFRHWLHRTFILTISGAVTMSQWWTLRKKSFLFEWNNLILLLSHWKYSPLYLTNIPSHLAIIGTHHRSQPSTCRHSGDLNGILIHPQTSNIGRTKYQNLNNSHLALQLSSPNPMKPGV